MKTIVTTEEELKELIHSSVLAALREHTPQSQPEQSDLISIEEAMKITFLARQTIYGLVFEKKLLLGKHYFKSGKKLLFSKKNILLWLQGKDNLQQENNP